jgi:hypothetical protein
MTFFMTIPRSWTPLQKQNTPEQKNNIAKPSATGVREKAGAIFAAIAWMVIVASLHHSLQNYKPRAVGFFNKITAFCRDCPTKLFINLILLAIRVGYGIASAWLWDLSIFQDDVVIGWPFGLGYGPILLIILVFEIAGFVEENEDKIIIQQRRERGIIQDQELGITKKPNWWKRNWAERYQTDEQRLKNMTTVGDSGRRQRTTRAVSNNIELGNMATANIRDRSSSRVRDDPFRDQSPESRQQSVTNTRSMPTRHESDAASTMTGASQATGLTGMTLTAEQMAQSNPQRIRSMLDV